MFSKNYSELLYYTIKIKNYELKIGPSIAKIQSFNFPIFQRKTCSIFNTQSDMNFITILRLKKNKRQIYRDV